MIIPSIVIPVALIISLNFFITHDRITALQYELLANNVSNIIVESESHYKTINALGMKDVVFYREATQKSIFLNIVKNLAPDTSIAIFNTQSHSVIYSYPEEADKLLLGTEHLQTMILQKKGQGEFDGITVSDSKSNTIAAFDIEPNWDWLIVSYIDEEH